MNKTNHDTREEILKATTHLCALYGCEGISMRQVGDQIPIAQSVIYHYYKDKAGLLGDMYARANRILGEERAKLPQPESATDMLRGRIKFQIDHAELIIAVLKYYLCYREDFAQVGSGALPEKATLHIEEVLQYGQQTGEFTVTDLPTQAKVIAHAINGYLLEYYPHMPTGAEADQLIEGIVQFSVQALQPTKHSPKKT